MLRTSAEWRAGVELKIYEAAGSASPSPSCYVSSFPIEVDCPTKRTILRIQPSAKHSDRAVQAVSPSLPSFVPHPSPQPKPMDASEKLQRNLTDYYPSHILSQCTRTKRHVKISLTIMLAAIRANARERYARHKLGSRNNLRETYVASRKLA